MGDNMPFVKVAKITEILPGKYKSVEVEGNDYLITNIEGNYYAMSNRCTHFHAALSEGVLNGRIIVCPKHHSSFDVVTGKSQSIHTHDITVYRVEIDGEDILIDV